MHRILCLCLNCRKPACLSFCMALSLWSRSSQALEALLHRRRSCFSSMPMRRCRCSRLRRSCLPCARRRHCPCRGQRTLSRPISSRLGSSSPCHLIRGRSCSPASRCSRRWSLRSSRCLSHSLAARQGLSMTRLALTSHTTRNPPARRPLPGRTACFLSSLHRCECLRLWSLRSMPGHRKSSFCSRRSRTGVDMLRNRHYNLCCPTCSCRCLCNQSNTLI